MSRWRDLLPTLRMLAAPVAGIVARWFRHAVRVLGLFALVMIVLAFTRVPFDAHRWLGTAGGLCTTAPGHIVVLGGSGMPSGPELLRLHCAAQLAQLYPKADLVVVHPDDTMTMRLMVDELVLRGVHATRISTLLEGGNTREQALRVKEAFPELARNAVAIVTAPENMYRTLGSFRKLGFAKVSGAPAFDHAMLVDFGYAHQKIGGKAWVPDVSDNLDLRYTFWNYLKLEITCLREAVAIGYYRTNGWV